MHRPVVAALVLAFALPARAQDPRHREVQPRAAPAPEPIEVEPEASPVAPTTTRDHGYGGFTGFAAVVPPVSASLQGGGLSFRIHGAPALALDLSVARLGGTDILQRHRTETPVALSALIYPAPGGTLQPYFPAGVFYDVSAVCEDGRTRDFRHVGGMLGFGLEVFLTRDLSVFGDARCMGEAQRKLPAPEAELQVWQVPLSRPYDLPASGMVMFTLRQPIPTPDSLAARARYAAGGALTDATQADVEAARIEADVAQEHARLETARTRINGLLLRDAAAPLGPRRAPNPGPWPRATQP